MNKQEKAITEYFDHWAPTYDEHLDSYHYNVPAQLFMAAQDFLAERRGPLRILDLGIGTGLSSEPFKALPNVHITGVDASDKMLSLCREKGVADELVQSGMAAGDLPLEKNSFDIVISSGAIEFIEDIGSLCHEVERLLMPDGIVIMAHETPKTRELYKPGFVTGILREDEEKITIRRKGYGSFFPRYYMKYLHEEESVEQNFGRAGIQKMAGQHFTAYQWSDDKQITYNLFVGSVFGKIPGF